MDVITVALGAKAIFEAVDKSIALLEKVTSKKKPSGEDAQIAQEVLERFQSKARVLAAIRKIIGFLYELLPETAKLHAFSDKLRETLVTNRTVLEGEEGKESDEHWGAVQNLFVTIRHLKGRVDLVDNRAVPLPKSREIGVLIEKCRQFNEAYDDAENFIISGAGQNVALLEKSCASMSKYASEMHGLIKYLIGDVLDAVLT